MNLTVKEKNIIRNSTPNFERKFDHYKNEWMKMGYDEHLSDELAWNSFIFMKQNMPYKSNDVSAIISGIQKIKPHPTEAIILFFNMNFSTLGEIDIFIGFLKNFFPDYKIIALPDKVSLESCSKDALENLINMIAEIIEEL